MPSEIELVWLLLLLLYFLIDLLLYLSIFQITSITVQDKKSLKLSVIIAVKNEFVNLSENLPFVLNQNHPDFEVIVVNDQSTDQTLKKLEAFSKIHKHLKIIDINKDKKSSKKHALDIGIENAKNEHLVFTDADCKPLSKDWLMELQNYFTTHHSVVLGYSPYQKTNSFLNKLIRFETLQTAINYFGFAKMGLAYMGVGRNLAYTKSLYNQMNGFQSHQHILSGDDDLLINQAANTHQIGLCINPNTFVESKPKTDFKSWIAQKRRHLTTAPHYRLKHKFLLSSQYGIRFLFWFFVFPVTLVIEYQNSFNGICLSILIITLFLKSLLNLNLYKRFKTQDLWIMSYFLEFMLILFQFYFFIRNLLSAKKTW